MDLSIIIVSYNTKDLTKQCLDALQKSLKQSKNLKIEIIVVDNASTDDSASMLENYPEFRIQNSEFRTIINKTNLGFGAANNQGIKKAKGKYILFLNSDVIADDVNIIELLKYMDKDQDVGALTVRVELSNGSIDPASHRGFPTVWRSFTYFSKLEKIFAAISLFSRIFGGYHLTHLDLNKTHEIDSPTAAFFLTRKDILDNIGGFDESFFMYGEDIDLSYRIKYEGFKVMYHPISTVIHLKHQSGLKSDGKVKKKTRKHFYNAMKIFYDKHYAQKNNTFINLLVHAIIDMKSRYHENRH